MYFFEKKVFKTDHGRCLFRTGFQLFLTLVTGKIHKEISYSVYNIVAKKKKKARLWACQKLAFHSFGSVLSNVLLLQLNETQLPGNFCFNCRWLRTKMVLKVQKAGFLRLRNKKSPLLAETKQVVWRLVSRSTFEFLAIWKWVNAFVLVNSCNSKAEKGKWWDERMTNGGLKETGNHWILFNWVWKAWTAPAVMCSSWPCEQTPLKRAGSEVTEHSYLWYLIYEGFSWGDVTIKHLKNTCVK